MVKQDRDLHPEDRQRRITALSHGSMFRLKAIKPDLCAGYLRAWAEDRKRWEFHLDQLPAGLSPATAIGWLPADGQSPLSYRLRRAPRVRNRPPLLRDPAVPPVPATLPVPAALPAPTDLPAPAALDPAVALVEAAPGVLAAAGAGG
jgi:hypothetical protein